MPFGDHATAIHAAHASEPPTATPHVGEVDVPCLLPTQNPEEPEFNMNFAERFSVIPEPPAGGLAVILASGVFGIIVLRRKV